MKALAFPWFVVMVRPLCNRGSLKAVEAGKLDRALMVCQVWAGSGLYSRSARNSSRFVCRTSSVSLRTSVLASRYSVRFSVTVLRRLFRRLMAARSSGVDHGLVYLPILDLPTRVLTAETKVLLSLRSRMMMVQAGRLPWMCRQHLQSLAN